MKITNVSEENENTKKTRVDNKDSVNPILLAFKTYHGLDAQKRRRFIELSEQIDRTPEKSKDILKLVENI